MAKNLTYNMDCLEGLKEYPNNHFELAIVDPPYGIDAPNMSMGANKSKNQSNTSDSVANKLRKARSSKRLNWDIKPTEAYFKELFRVSKNQIIWVGNYFDLPPTRGVVCWDKKQPWPNFSQFELAWTSFDKVARLFSYSSRGGANNEAKIHPTQKPVKLYEWLLVNYADEGDKILDTHLGSGSSRIAAHNLGFDFTGYEIDKQYYQDQERRYKTITAQMKLF